MNNVSLVLYVIRCRSIEDKKYINLDNISGKTLVEVFNDYCSERKNISRNDGLKKAINIKTININKNSFSGQLETGKYGYSSKIKEVTTSIITHEKTDKEAEMIPLFFNGVVPDNAYKALVALEKFRTFGCKTILENDLNKFLEEKDYKVKIDLHPILPEKVAKQYLSKGNICRMRLVKHSVPKDIADIYKDQYKNGEFGTFEYVINPKKNKYLPFKSDINKFLNNSIGLKNIIEVQGIDYDNIKVEVEIGNKKRTISLNNISKLTGDIDVSNDIEFEIDGHPKYSSILDISKDIIKEYINVIDYKNYKFEGNLEACGEVQVDAEPIAVR
ncbi:hypothetical protein DVW07_11975 [Clostridium botulinum]|uniref:hypothetical protein n=1 Tax=Clostridium botulinum TaxID=1491 RepID=UPI00196772A0|nr:hypothetical protein [Clostridium botulinum]MBN1042775.1 hypothetical protein [Clostridium botulinum]